MSSLQKGFMRTRFFPSAANNTIATVMNYRFDSVVVVSVYDILQD